MAFGEMETSSTIMLPPSHFTEGHTEAQRQDLCLQLCSKRMTELR